MPYTAQKPGGHHDPEELRARIPGWGADVDPEDRPAFPREQPGIATGAHWTMPEQQNWTSEREKSVEHERLTPVFGTAQPLRGVSGAIRRYAYDRYSEGQAAHWLLLLAGDRVESTGAHLRSFLTTRPDDPVTQSGIFGERGRHPISSRLRPGRVDMKHAWLDPILVVGPWVLAAGLVFQAVRMVARLGRRS
ncbi:hypothetical protein [Microbacterium flavescens]|uniref:hypothetical protein n=1 Tax=Microbacterium flavescens TaxID=69366 RepID=UPI001BDDCB32|nr:hypothetical protein [Microbacterium flavescens]BFF08734.1 hypothetical protein GCM10025699_00370 [Microbacterium flavescens]BFF12507.1 hypothetical protein GCM10025699_38100 [Microbacterium flavescens]